MIHRSSKPSPRRWARAASAVGCLLLAACPSEPAEPKLVRPSLVLVTIDTLRADHVGCYGYFRNTTPNIDAFAKEAVLFEQAYATMATTLPSHASMLTSRYPLEHGIQANLQHGGNPFGWKEGMLSFAEVARDAGYATAAFVSSAPLKSQSGINAGFAHWSEPGESQVERKAGETVGDALAWLDAQESEPFFLWVHVFDPHWPHRAPAPFDTQFHSEEPDPALEKWITDRRIGESSVRSNAKKTTETRKAINNYCGEVAYADSEVGKLLDALKARGLYERSIVTITADHGEGLNQHDWTAHGLVWEEQLRVPLLMRFPAAAMQAPRRVKPIVSLIDLVPTWLARIEPWGTPGWQRFLDSASGADALAADFEERPVYAQRTGREMERDPGEMYALTMHEWKYIHEPEVGDKLFHRLRDPFELDNVLESEPKAARDTHRLTMLMRELQTKRGAAFGEGAAGKMDEELLRQMRALGYMGGEDGRSGEEAPKEPTPSDPERKEP